MGLLTLFEVASMPIIQVLMISALGAFMATDYFSLLPSTTRKSLNKIVFMIFTPSLSFASLAQTVTFHDVISWWFMPINIGITFLCGGILGWIAVKIIKPKPHLEGLTMAMCSAGNLGNLMIIIVPAICTEEGSPFGDHNICHSHGLSYTSFSMALGGFYIWTHTYYLIRNSAKQCQALKELEGEFSKQPNKDLDSNEKTWLLNGDAQARIDMENQTHNVSQEPETESVLFINKLVGVLHTILEELLAPPTLGAIAGFIFGTIPWLKNLIIGDAAPLRVIQDSIKLLGDGTIPCITLILGGNLTQGLRKANVRPLIIISVICVRYVILPVIGIGVVTAAGNLGLLPADRLFHFVLMLQFAMPPAMNIGTMTQLFDVGQEECSVLMMWSYLAAAFALTAWSTIFMSILS